MTKWLTLATALVVILVGIPAAAEDCVNISLGAEIVPGVRGDVLSLYFQGGNCGAEPGLAQFTATAAKCGTVVGSAKFSVNVPAGVPIRRSIGLPLPPGTPPGCYTLCLEVELGTAYDASCATVTVGSGCELLGFYPDDSTSGGVSTWSWGEIKAGYK
ncbi:MAG: hypothetical protein ABIJ00_13330 [Candidatus Eisenbacteria bacterium]